MQVSYRHELLHEHISNSWCCPLKLPDRKIDRESRLNFLNHREDIFETNRPKLILFEDDVAMSEGLEVKVDDFVLDQRVDVIIEMSFRKSFGAQASKDLVEDLFALVDVKIFVSVHEVASIFHVDAVWLADVEEIFWVVPIGAQEFDLASKEGHRFAYLGDFGADFLDSFFSFGLLEGELIDFFLVLVDLFVQKSRYAFLGLLHFHAHQSHVLQLFIVAQIFGLIDLQLGYKLSFFFGKLLHFFWFYRNQLVKFIDFAEALNERDDQVDLSMQVELFRKGQPFKGSLHAGNSRKISQYFLRALHEHVLIEFRIIIEMYQQSKEGMLIEDAHIVGFVLIKDITEVDLQ